MSAKTTIDPMTGVALAAEESRRSGALTCLAAMRQLLAAAEDMPNDAAGFFSKQHADAQAFATSLGPVPPFAQGAIIALAEYIHHWETAGGPDLEHWTPEAAKTKAEREQDIAAARWKRPTVRWQHEEPHHARHSPRAAGLAPARRPSRRRRPAVEARHAQQRCRRPGDVP